MISGLTMKAGLTFRKRIPKRVRKETRTPEARAVIHSPIGMNRKKTTRRRKPRKSRTRKKPGAIVFRSTVPSLRMKSYVRSDGPDDVPIAVALHHLDGGPRLDELAFGHHVKPFVKAG